MLIIQLSDLMPSLDILSKTGMLLRHAYRVAGLRLPENARLILDIFFVISA